MVDFSLFRFVRREIYSPSAEWTSTTGKHIDSEQLYCRYIIHERRIRFHNQIPYHMQFCGYCLVTIYNPARYSCCLQLGTISC